MTSNDAYEGPRTIWQTTTIEVVERLMDYCHLSPNVQGAIFGYRGRHNIGGSCEIPRIVLCISADKSQIYVDVTAFPEEFHATLDPSSPTVRDAPSQDQDK